MMMRRSINRKSKATTTSIPAPLGGLNARDSIADMSPLDALKMDNFFPERGYVSLRKGSATHATALPAWVETLVGYSNPTTNKLFGFSDGKLYDVTSAGAVGAAVVSSLTNSRWESSMFSNSGGYYLYTVNGADKPLLYDGTNWTAIDGSSTPAITGVTTTLLTNVNVFKNRLWFVEKNSFRIWYLATSAIGGAATSIDFGPLFKRGGYLLAMVTCSIDNAGGIDDYAAFVSSEGEIALYKGTDPSSAATWALVGMFRIGRPVGKRFHAKMGPDTIMITEDGVMPLSRVLLTDRVQTENAITDKIRPLIQQDIQGYGVNFGWNATLFPSGNKLLINVPVIESSQQRQYVMNLQTGAWCRFTGWNAACFCVLNDKLYFGTSTKVVRADFGTSDCDSCIVTGEIQQAFSYFQTPGRNKKFNMIRPILASEDLITAAITLNVDFKDDPPRSTPSYSGTGGSPWDTSPWDTSPWGGLDKIRRDWYTVGNIGFSAGVRMNLSSKNFGVKWLATDFVYELGGVL